MHQLLFQISNRYFVSDVLTESSGVAMVTEIRSEIHCVFFQTEAYSFRNFWNFCY